MHTHEVQILRRAGIKMYASQLAQQSFLALDAGYEGLKQDAMVSAGRGT